MEFFQRSKDKAFCVLVKEEIELKDFRWRLENRFAKGEFLERLQGVFYYSPYAKQEPNSSKEITGWFYATFPLEKDHHWIRVKKGEIVGDWLTTPVKVAQENALMGANDCYPIRPDIYEHVKEEIEEISKDYISKKNFYYYRATTAEVVIEEIENNTFVWIVTEEDKNATRLNNVRKRVFDDREELIEYLVDQMISPFNRARRRK